MPPKTRVVDAVAEMARPVAQRIGLMIWDVRFVKEGATWYLRIFIDKPGGVFISDCEDLSKAIDPLLDEADLIAQSYILEVSSPGIERELTRDEHFEWMTGRRILIRLIRPLDGVREFTGRLVALRGGSIVMETATGEIEIPRDAAAFVKLHEE